MKAVLSSEILRPKGGRELLESWGVEEWTLRVALKGSCVALLHLNWMALRIFTTSNCEHLKMLAGPLLITCMYLLCCLSLFIFNRPSSFIAAKIFPLEKIRYTQRMNVALRKKIVCTKRCLRSWQRMVFDLLRWNSAWHDHPMFSFTSCRCSFLRRPVTCFWQYLKRSVSLHRNSKSIWTEDILIGVILSKEEIWFCQIINVIRGS